MSLVYGPPNSFDTSSIPEKTVYNSQSVILKIVLIFIVPLIFLIGLVVYIVSKVKSKKPVSIIVVIVLSVISALLIMGAIYTCFFYM